MAERKLPKLVKGAQYGSTKAYMKGPKEKIEYEPGYTPRFYQPKTQKEYDDWVRRAKEQGVEPESRKKGGTVKKAKKLVAKAKTKARKATPKVRKATTKRTKK